MIHTFYFDDIYDYFFVFLRLSALFMLFPGIGEAFVPVRVRLLLSFVLTLVITPVIDAGLPSTELMAAETLMYILKEILFGTFLGLLARILLSSLQIAGTIIGLQTSLSGAAILNPTLGMQDTAIGTLLMFAVITMMFATDCHYLLIATLISSYEVFPPTGPVLIGDFSQAITEIIAQSFWLGIKLSLPVIIVGLLLSICIGLVNRLMPQMQVYFMFAPVQMFLGFMLLAIIISSIVSVFIDSFRDFLTGVANG